MDTTTIITILTIIGTGISVVAIIKGDIRDIRKATHDTKNELTALKTELKVRNVIATSPLSLSPTGKENLENSGAKAFIDKYFNDIYEQFKGIETNYEIHDKALEIAHDIYKNDTNFIPVKRNAYNAGIEDFVLMVAIELRDRVCNKKDIPVKDNQHAVQHP